MKKIVLMAAFMVASIAASAQVYVGGSLGLESLKANKDANTTTSFSIQPEIGYNLDENWAVGINLGFASTNDEGYFTVGNATGVKSENTVSCFTIAPYARYTFAKTGIASFFVDGGISYTTYGSDAEGSSFGVGFRPGVKLTASKKVDFIAKLGYFGYQKNDDDLGGGEAIGLNIDNSSLSFGVLYNF